MSLLRINPFIKKLYEILKNPLYDSIIRWKDDESFQILSKENLSEIVLRENFKTTSLSSFIRQLNKYGFKKQRKENSFKNKDFVRGREDLLKNIKIKHSSTHVYEIKQNELHSTCNNEKIVLSLQITNKILRQVYNLWMGRHRNVCRILIYEDFDSRALVNNLDEMKYETETAFFLNEFEDLLRDKLYDYLVIDYNKLALFRRISTYTRYLLRLKVIVSIPEHLSAPDVSEILIKNEGFIVKPYTVLGLVKIIKKN